VWLTKWELKHTRDNLELAWSSFRPTIRLHCAQPLFFMISRCVISLKDYDSQPRITTVNSILWLVLNFVIGATGNSDRELTSFDVDRDRILLWDSPEFWVAPLCSVSKFQKSCNDLFIQLDESASNPVKIMTSKLQQHIDASQYINAHSQSRDSISIALHE